MNDPRTAEATAIKLAELSHEIDELETNRALLLKRVDAMRAALLSAGNRTTAIRASVDLLCEHITNVVMARGTTIDSIAFATARRAAIAGHTDI